MERPRLSSVELKNFLGAGNDPVHLDFHAKAVALCGANNSGKSTVLEAIDIIKTICSKLGASPRIQYQSTWVPEDRASADMFHWEAKTSRLKATFLVPRSFSPVTSVLGLVGVPAKPGSVRVSLTISLKIGASLLESISVEDAEVFSSKAETVAFLYQGNPRQHIARHPPLTQVLEWPKLLTQGIIYFPSTRVVSAGDQNSMTQMAAGLGIPNWIRAATNPSPKSESQTAKA